MNKYGGSPDGRTEIYAARVSYAADDVHRPPLHSSAAAVGQTDRQTDGLSTIQYACRVRKRQPILDYRA